jgi:hypothetical protein
MNKQTKMIVGFSAVALAAYLIYQQNQKKATTASFSGGVGSPRMRNAIGLAANTCCGHTGKTANGKFICCNGQLGTDSLGKDCNTPAPEGCKGRKGKLQSVVTQADFSGRIFR